MPKSRDQRCRSVIRNFFELHTNLNKVYYEFSKKKESGWKIAHYQINIPNKWESQEPQYNTETQTLHWNTIEHVQELPTKEKMEEIVQTFKDKFEPYEKSIEFRSGRKRVTSYLRIYQSDLEENNCNIRIMVMYNGQEIPFSEDEPDPKVLIEKLERENKGMKQRLQHFHQQINRELRHLNQINTRLIEEIHIANDTVDSCYMSFQLSNIKYMRSYRDIINECYNENNKSFDCPVCYEIIKSGEVFTTPCNHVICNDCAKHCKNSCPMCRQDMCCVIDDIPPLQELDDDMPPLIPIDDDMPHLIPVPHGI
jgi:hypothetical protein